MRKSKFISSLRLLSGHQRNRFEAFVCSPYFNRNQNNIALYAYIQRYAPSFTHDRLSREEVRHHWPLEGKADAKTLAYTLSALQGLLEKFLAVEALGQDPFREAEYLLWWARNVHDDAIARKAEKSLNRLLDKYPVQDQTYFEQTYRMRRLEHLLYGSERERRYDETLQATSDALDAFYLLTKFRLAWSMAQLEYMLDRDYRHTFEEALLRESAQMPLDSFPAIQVFRSALLMVHHYEDPDCYDQLRELVQHHAPILSAEDQLDLYRGMLNYCIRRINQYDEWRFREEYLDLNVHLLDRGMLLEDGQLSPWRFTNLVATGLQVRRADWVRTFIADYSGYLPEAYRQNIRDYNLGYMHHYLGELDDAMATLAKVEFEDPLFNLVLRSLLSKVYYEAGETELLLSYLEANRLFLHRDQSLSPERRGQAQAFFDHLRKLARIPDFEQHRIARLLDELPEASEVMNRDWLQRQIEKRLTG